MKASLQKLCEEFIANRDTVKSAFKWEMDYIYPVCANLFCAKGQPADPERLKACRKVIEANTGVFSNFRGNVKPVLASMLALGEDPEGQLEQAKAYYDLLKQEFWGSSFLALVSFLLTDLAEPRQVEENTARGKSIYRRMKKEHPFLTGSEDSVFAVLMAFSDRSEDQLISDMEACYTALKERFSIGDQLQTVSHVLTLAGGAPREQALRLMELFDALRNAGIKYGKSHELATLAALSLTDTPISTLVEEIGEVDAFLKEQKGYGVLGIGKQQRAMNAAMIVSDQYTAQADVNTAAVATTLSMIIAIQIAMCAAVAASASASSSSN